MSNDARSRLAQKLKSDRPYTDRIGTHLATLNLFREPDGTVEITCAEARGAIREIGVNDTVPADYVDELIVQAADRIKVRQNKATKSENTPHRIERQSDEYACSCGARWDVSDSDGHP